MPYESPGALRAALESRLLTRSRETGADLERLRRRAVFERLLVRLDAAEPGRWVLKGGMAIEVRLGDRARMTRDLDLVLRDGEHADVRELIVEAMTDDPDGDGFEFFVDELQPLRADEAGRPGWRAPIDARLDGRRFARVRVDVVARADEITATTRMRLPGVLSFADVPVREIEVVEPRQQFAEKLHAYTRDYGDVPNSRVKDLADMVLLIDNGLAADAALRGSVEHVFAVRSTHIVPGEPPDPPASWREPYAGYVEELGLSALTLDDAIDRLRSFWSVTLATKE